VKTLLDTCVISELQRENGNPAVRKAVTAIAPGDLFLSALTIGELSKGIALLHTGKKKQYLSIWLSHLQSEFADRIMVVDAETSIIWGDLTARLQRAGTIIPAIDGLLAATAIKHKMILMTRNIRHFRDTDLAILDPWTNK
jgi:toxin FitB